MFHAIWFYILAIEPKHSKRKTAVLSILAAVLSEAVSLFSFVYFDSKQQALTVTFYVASVIYAFFYIFLMQGGKKLKALFIYFTYICIWAAMYVVVMILTRNVLGGWQPAMWILRSVFNIVFLIIYYRCFKVRLLKCMPAVEQVSNVLIPASGMIYLVVPTLMIYYAYSDQTAISLAIVIFLLLFCFTFYVLIFRFIRQVGREKEFQAIEMQNKYLKDTVQNFENMEREAQQNRHDYHHHNLILLQYARNGDADAIIEYLDGFETCEQKKTARLCINRTVDNILRAYLRKAEQVNITMKVHAQMDSTTTIQDAQFACVLTGMALGAYDMGAAGCTITDERKENVDFSAPYHTEDIVLVVRGNAATSLTGSLYGGYSQELFPNAEIREFNNFADVLMALRQGKVDGTMLDRPNFNSVRRTDDKLSCMTVPQYSVEIGFGFQKTESGYALQAQMNEFLDELRADGTIDEMLDKWYGETEPEESVPLDEFSGNSQRLRVSIDTTRKPFVYMYEGKPVGFEIEVLYLFCSEYGYDIEISDVSFASGLAGLAGEKYDLVCGGLYMTPERKESVNFSEPYMVADVVMATYEKSGFENFFASIGESFEKTFIRENRWQLIAEGVITTLRTH